MKSTALKYNINNMCNTNIIGNYSDTSSSLTTKDCDNSKIRINNKIQGLGIIDQNPIEFDKIKTQLQVDNETNVENFKELNKLIEYNLLNQAIIVNSLVDLIKYIDSANLKAFLYVHTPSAYDSQTNNKPKKSGCINITKSPNHQNQINSNLIGNNLPNLKKILCELEAIQNDINNKIKIRVNEVLKDATNTITKFDNEKISPSVLDTKSQLLSAKSNIFSVKRSSLPILTTGNLGLSSNRKGYNENFKEKTSLFDDYHKEELKKNPPQISNLARDIGSPTFENGQFNSDLKQDENLSKLHNGNITTAASTHRFMGSSPNSYRETKGYSKNKLKQELDTLEIKDVQLTIGITQANPVKDSVKKISSPKGNPENTKIVATLNSKSLQETQKTCPCDELNEININPTHSLIKGDFNIKKENSDNLNHEIKDNFKNKKDDIILEEKSSSGINEEIQSKINQNIFLEKIIINDEYHHIHGTMQHQIPKANSKQISIKKIHDIHDWIKPKKNDSRQGNSPKKDNTDNTLAEYDLTQNMNSQIFSNNDIDKMYKTIEIDHNNIILNKNVISSSATQKIAIKNLLKEYGQENNPKAELGEKNEKKYLISAKWWRAWKEYVNYEATDCLTNEYIDFSNYPKPGIIYNKELLKQDAIEDLGNIPSELELKPNLLENHDYIAVNKRIFDMLKNWYGCDFEIIRILNPDPFYPGKLYLDLYPNRNNNTFKIATKNMNDKQSINKARVNDILNMNLANIKNIKGLHN